MASFATPADLQTFLGLPSIDTTRAQQLLDDATALIKEATDQFIEAVTGEVIRLGSLDRDTLLLPERPVTAVTLVKVDGVTIPSSDYIFTSAGFLQRVAGAETWLAGPLGIEVTYNHGFATIPSDIKTICKGAAARALTMNERGASEPMGSFMALQSVGWAPEVFLTPAERMELMSYGPIPIG